MMYTYDLETSYNGEEAWAWSWGLCAEDLSTTDGNGTTALRALTGLPDGSEVWVHNLPYDGEYVLWMAQAAGYTLRYDLSPRQRYHGVIEPKEDLSGMLSLTIWTEGRRVVLRDSMRIFRAPLADLPKICGFEAQDVKLEMDYDVIRPRDYDKDQSERDYQLADVRVLMRAMLWLRAQGAKGNTVGSIALNEYRISLGRHSPFVPLSTEQLRRYSSLYSGGMCTVGQELEGVTLRPVSGRRYDLNSAYPHKLRDAYLPIAVIGHYTGSLPRWYWEHDAAVHVVARGLRLKPYGVPMLITPFTGRGRVDIPALDKWLYAPEWAAIREEYDIDEYEEIEWVRFDTARIGEAFVDHWYGIKQANKGPLRTYAKYVLNNVTGKLAEHPDHEQVRRKRVDDGSYIYYRHNEVTSEVNKWSFMPATAAICSMTRLQVRDAVIKSGRDLLHYIDTDSVHTTGELPASVVGDALGAWDLEAEYDSACYVKPKTYWETRDGVSVAQKHAGINAKATLWVDGRDTGERISPSNMVAGAAYRTKQAKRVRGGVAIVDIIKHI